MDIITDIGPVSLTENQILNYTPQGVFSGFSYVEGKVLAISQTAPQQSDIDALKVQLAALPDVTPQYVYIDRFSFNTFWGQVYATLSFDAADALTQFSRAIELLWSYPNIAGIRPFLQSKVGRNYNGYVVVQSDVDTLIAAFADQGVVLP